MSEGLVQFIRERLAEDEAWTLDLLGDVDYERCRTSGSLGRKNLLALSAIASPRRVLADVDAKRRILAECGWAVENGHGSAFVKPVLRLLALPYRDHPDYEPDWTPV